MEKVSEYAIGFAQARNSIPSRCAFFLKFEPSAPRAHRSKICAHTNASRPGFKSNLAQTSLRIKAESKPDDAQTLDFHPAAATPRYWKLNFRACKIHSSQITPRVQMQPHPNNAQASEARFSNYRPSPSQATPRVKTQPNADHIQSLYPRF